MGKQKIEMHKLLEDVVMSPNLSQPKKFFFT